MHVFNRFFMVLNLRDGMEQRIEYADAKTSSQACEALEKNVKAYIESQDTDTPIKGTSIVTFANTRVHEEGVNQVTLGWVMIGQVIGAYLEVEQVMLSDHEVKDMGGDDS